MLRVSTVGIMQMNPLFKNALTGATKEVLKQSGIIFRDTVKQLTTDEDHVVTGRYRSSVGNMASSDGVFQFSTDGMELDVGTNVPYSELLEARYNIFMRALDIASPKAAAQIGVTFFKYLDSHS